MAMFTQQFAQTGLAGMVSAVQPAPELPPGQTLPGKVKAWMDDKGFGFITPDNGGPDVFVHRNQLSDGQSLMAGAAVMFECRLNPARGKYEATTCSGAAGGVPGVAGAVAVPGVPGVPGVLASQVANAKGLAFGKGMKGSQDNLFVAGLPIDCNEEAIRELFGQYGIVQQCKVLPDTPGKTDRAALVRFADENQAKWMVENLNGKALPGMVAPLTVRFAGDRPEKGGCYGKDMGKGGTVVDARFSPYGGVGVAAQPVATANPQLSEATLAAALVQLLPGLNQGMQPLQCLQGAQGLGAVGGVQVGLGAPDTSPAAGAITGALAAGQSFGGQALNSQTLGAQPLLGQALSSQVLANSMLSGQVLGGQAIGNQVLTGQTLGGQAISNQTLGGQVVTSQPLQSQVVTSQAFGTQPLGGSVLTSQSLNGQVLAGQVVGGQAVGGQTLAGQALVGQVGGQALGTQVIGGQVLNGQALAGQQAGVQQSGNLLLAAAPANGQPLGSQQLASQPLGTAPLAGVPLGTTDPGLAGAASLGSIAAGAPVSIVGAALTGGSTMMGATASIEGQPQGSQLPAAQFSGALLSGGDPAVAASSTLTASSTAAVGAMAAGAATSVTSAPAVTTPALAPAAGLAATPTAAQAAEPAATLATAAAASATIPAAATAAAPAAVPAVATAPAAATPAAATAAAATHAAAPAVAPAAAPAQGGQWLEATDPASGRPYYYHSVTRDVRWDKPVEQVSSGFCPCTRRNCGSSSTSRERALPPWLKTPYGSEQWHPGSWWNHFLATSYGRAGHESGCEAALKLFLAELQYTDVDQDGHVVFTPSRFRLRRVWIQGYVVCRDGDDVVDIDDGSDVMSFDIGALLLANPAVNDTLQSGRYVSCVSTLEMHPQGVLDLCMESVCEVDGKTDALAEPFWWLEVAEAHRIWSSALGRSAPSGAVAPVAPRAQALQWQRCEAKKQPWSCRREAAGTPVRQGLGRTAGAPAPAEGGRLGRPRRLSMLRPHIGPPGGAAGCVWPRGAQRRQAQAVSARPWWALAGS
eukprot:CAMPEP_0179093746 /NCGR_PEP_ID=MMETSP0796-20121207/42952_1 /TAXON_ID=73915 /ORGANISM="Pyrodinium bahamense, Strain pbaha01" /LENGTH=1034 /DNA_ID=CAMNT_0020791393 /DNA_START=88 /DNA_END=3190 /DNA_ORIENTATION=+